MLSRKDIPSLDGISPVFSSVLAGLSFFINFAYICSVKHYIMQDVQEVWKDVVGYEGLYQVSNLGRVKSLDRQIIRSNGTGYFVKEKILKSSLRNGYPCVSLHSDKGRKKYTHRLIAEAFIPNPKNKPEVNHINGIKNDNRIKNLEWATYSENIKHAYNTGLRIHNVGKGEKCPRSKLTEKQILKIREKYTTGNYTYKQLADEYSVTDTTIGLIIRRENWSHI